MILAGEARVSSVTAIEGDALPVDKVTGRRRRDAESIVIVNHPSATLAHSTSGIIELDC